MRISALKNGVWLLLGLTVTGLIWRYGTPSDGIDTPDLKWSTSVERSESLEAMRTAWHHRNREHTPQNDSSERAFINRLILVVSKVQKTETAGEAASLLATAYSEHTAQYEKRR